MKECFPKKPKTCPKCIERKGALIIRGLPGLSPELEAALERGAISLGGCLIGEVMPTHWCAACGHEWGKTLLS